MKDHFKFHRWRDRNFDYRIVYRRLSSCCWVREKSRCSFLVAGEFRGKTRARMQSRLHNSHSMKREAIGACERVSTARRSNKRRFRKKKGGERAFRPRNSPKSSISVTEVAVAVAPALGGHASFRESRLRLKISPAESRNFIRAGYALSASENASTETETRVPLRLTL